MSTIEVNFSEARKYFFFEEHDEHSKTKYEIPNGFKYKKLQNNNIDYGYGNFNEFKFKKIEDMYKLSNWISPSINLRKDVIDNTIVNYYKIKYTISNDTSFMLFEFKLVEKLLNNIIKKYKSNYEKSLWFLGQQEELNKPYFSIEKNKIFNEDPVFAQKVKVNDLANPEIIFIGDIHSSLHSLLDIFLDLANKFYINEAFEIKENIYIFFLGDFVDRGPYSIEILIFW